MTKPRTLCPACGKAQRGAKGLKAHQAAMHPPRPSRDPEEIDRVEAELRQTMAAAPFPDAAHHYGMEHPEILP